MKIFFLIVDQHCCSDLHLRWRAACASHYVIYLTIWCINRQRQMSRLERSHLTVFSRSSYLPILTKYIKNILTTLILIGWKYSIESTVVFSKSLYLHSHKKCHSWQGISEKEHIKSYAQFLFLCNPLKSRV